MACSQTLSGILRDCEPNAGGIKEIYIANADDVTAIALDSTGAEISSITMATSAKFKKFYFRAGQASASFTPQFNESGEYAGEEGTVTVNFGRMDTTKRAQMAALSIAELVVIYKDNNGLNWLLGYDHPVMRNGGDSGPGGQKTDFNKYGLQLVSRDNQLPFELDDTVLAGII